MLPLLQCSNLSISFENDNKKTEAVKNISFSLFKNKITAIVGESGSGKTLTAFSILQLNNKNAIISGEILFQESASKPPINILEIKNKSIENIRGNNISMIFQEPMTALNPLMKCGAQVAEMITRHQHLSKKSAKEKVIQLFKDVELPNPENIFSSYPHQLSGGQKQRIMIAMAISCNPTLLIADEPTTALDVRIQQNIIELLKKLQSKFQLSILLITHDIGLVADIADEVLVMNKGEIVEQGDTNTVIFSPKNEYTKSLLNCIPKKNYKGNKLPSLNDSIITNLKIESISNSQKLSPILKVSNLSIDYVKKNIWGKTISIKKAIDDVSFEVFQNETIGIVGESGCGKTTLGKALLQLIPPTSGSIDFRSESISKNNLRFDPSHKKKIFHKEIQLVFQDPYGSLNPRMTISDAITEPMKVHHLVYGKKYLEEKSRDLFQKVGLNPDHINRYPHQFSGGQRQRICIARALASEPSFIVFDESVSALDVSIQAQILNLINELKNTFKFTSLFISHDLSVIHYISDRILVLKDGKIVESGNADDIFTNPTNNYTKSLLNAMTGKKLQLFNN